MSVFSSGADTHLFAGAGDGREQAEEPLVADQSGVLQLSAMLPMSSSAVISMVILVVEDVPAESTGRWPAASPSPARMAEATSTHRDIQTLIRRRCAAAAADGLPCSSPYGPPGCGAPGTRPQLAGRRRFVIRHRNLHFSRPGGAPPETSRDGEEIFPSLQFFSGQAPWKPGA